MLINLNYLFQIKKQYTTFWHALPPVAYKNVSPWAKYETALFTILNHLAGSFNVVSLKITMTIRMVAWFCIARSNTYHSLSSWNLLFEEVLHFFQPSNFYTRKHLSSFIRRPNKPLCPATSDVLWRQHRNSIRLPREKILITKDSWGAKI